MTVWYETHARGTGITSGKILNILTTKQCHTFAPFFTSLIATFESYSRKLIYLNTETEEQSNESDTPFYRYHDLRRSREFIADVEEVRS